MWIYRHTSKLLPVNTNLPSHKMRNTFLNRMLKKRESILELFSATDCANVCNISHQSILLFQDLKWAKLFSDKNSFSFPPTKLLWNIAILFIQVDKSIKKGYFSQKEPFVKLKRD